MKKGFGVTAASIRNHQYKSKTLTTHFQISTVLCKQNIVPFQSFHLGPMCFLASIQRKVQIISKEDKELKQEALSLHNK